MVIVRLASGAATTAEITVKLLTLAVDARR